MKIYGIVMSKVPLEIRLGMSGMDGLSLAIESSSYLGNGIQCSYQEGRPTSCFANSCQNHQLPLLLAHMANWTLDSARLHKLYKLPPGTQLFF